jgi:O-6-methylguanine DNA methyltransferase
MNIKKNTLTVFEQNVLKELMLIPEGQTKSYKEIARLIGKPSAYRAVANACAKNPYPKIIPCHRVIRSDGSIGGYSATGGIKMKRKLLNQESKI